MRQCRDRKFQRNTLSSSHSSILFPTTALRQAYIISQWLVKSIVLFLSTSFAFLFLLSSGYKLHCQLFANEIFDIPTCIESSVRLNICFVKKSAIALNRLGNF